MINNTVTPGFIKSPFQFSYNQGGTQTSTQAIPNAGSNVLGQIGSAVNSYRNQGLPSVPGLVSPSHPSPGSLPTTSPLASHSFTTNPDGTSTTKITYTNPAADNSSNEVNQNQANAAKLGVTIPGSSETTTGGSTNNPQPTQTPPASQGGNPYIAPLADSSQAGSQLGNQFIIKTGQYGAGNIPIGQQAANIAAQYGQKIADVGQKGAAFEGGQLTTGTSPVAQGNAAITAQTTAAQQQALATGESAALQGTAQQLTAQNQAANATNEAGGLAYTGQGLQQSGLNQAGALAQPYPTAPGQTVFYPATGQYTNGGNGTGSPGTAPSGIDQGAWSNYVNMAANGQYSAIPSSITSNANLSGQLNAAAQAQNPNFNPVTSAASGSSASDLTGQASGIQAQANGAEQNFNLMLNIAQQGGVNDSNVPILNTLQQNVQKGLTSSANVASFQSLIQSVRSQYAAILGGGTVTVEALQEAQSLVPDNISISSLQTLGTNLKSDAANRVAGINQQISSLTGGGSNQGGSGGSSGWASLGD